jgi:hypothetical protein
MGLLYDQAQRFADDLPAEKWLDQRKWEDWG